MSIGLSFLVIKIIKNNNKFANNVIGRTKSRTILVCCNIKVIKSNVSKDNRIIFDNLKVQNSRRKIKDASAIAYKLLMETIKEKLKLKS
jgi:hypothetical protein